MKKIIERAKRLFPKLYKSKAVRTAGIAAACFSSAACGTTNYRYAGVTATPVATTAANTDYVERHYVTLPPVMAISPETAVPVLDVPVIDTTMFDEPEVQEEIVPVQQSTLVEGKTDREVLEFVTRYEGLKSCMYRDKGGVAVGRGHHMTSAGRAQQLDFKTVRNGHVVNASNAEIARAYHNAPRSPNCARATVFLDIQTIDQIAEEDIYKALGEVQRTVRGYDAYPADAQIVLIEMMYNMGAGNFNERKWPKFFTALKRGDYETAALETRSTDIQRARNVERREVMMAAARPVIDNGIRLADARIRTGRQLGVAANTQRVSNSNTVGFQNASYGFSNVSRIETASMPYDSRRRPEARSAAAIYASFANQ